MTLQSSLCLVFLVHMSLVIHSATLFSPSNIFCRCLPLLSFPLIIQNVLVSLFSSHGQRKKIAWRLCILCMSHLLASFDFFAIFLFFSRHLVLNLIHFCFYDRYFELCPLFVHFLSFSLHFKFISNSQAIFFSKGLVGF